MHSLLPPEIQETIQGEGWCCVFSGPVNAGLWPERIVYVDARVPFTVAIRLLQATEEKR
jgi:hypothetical protein